MEASTKYRVQYRMKPYDDAKAAKEWNARTQSVMQLKAKRLMAYFIYITAESSKQGAHKLAP